MLYSTTGPYKVQCGTENTGSIEKDRINFSVRFEQMKTAVVVPSRMEFTAGLHNTSGQSRPGTQRIGEENSSSPPDPNDPDPTEHASNLAVGCHGKRDQTKYEFQPYECIAKNDTYEPASELPTTFFQRYWSAKRQ